MFITRVRLDRLDGLPAWVQALPAVRSLYHVPLPLGAVTIVTGDNGAGKSTLMEALAVAMRVNVEGGSATPASPSPTRNTSRAGRSSSRENVTPQTSSSSAAKPSFTWAFTTLRWVGRSRNCPNSATAKA
ncbi:AAA family ATPase [Corynebacterium cystitidis]|uniref:AAA family ATPase n=1 Tax=Corynebacterium cystitidis TaxID=35757 RepID=UPI00211DE841|nr:AAA family ATPase [Corynebacterium cystitidis]